VALGDYASRNVVPELQRLPGVGQAQLFGTERAMRIWIDPAKLLGYNLSAADVTAAIRAQNAQVSAGEIGSLPNVAGQGIAATVVVNGQLSTWSSSATSCCAPTPTAPPCASRTWHALNWAPDLRHLGPPERQAVHRHRRAALAHRQRAGHGQGVRAKHERAGALLSPRA
jgi:multidrug efflux pump subunit AcrB